MQFKNENIKTKAGFFGYWLDVHDDPSARHAIRMGGVPALVMGLSWGLSSLVLFALPQSADHYLMAKMIGVGALILWITAFAIRAGYAWFIPLMLIFLGFSLIGLAFETYLIWASGVWLGPIGMKPLVTDNKLFALMLSIVIWVIPILCAALALSSVRGWLWRYRGNNHGNAS